MEVYLIGVTTICGRIGPGLIGSSLDRRHLEEMRSKTDASLLGAGTLRQGDPEMRGPGGRLDPGRHRAVITHSGRIPVRDRKLFAHEPPPVLFCGHDRAGALSESLGDKARVIILPEGPGGLSVRAAVRELGRLGAKSVLIEGGARLNYAALAEGVPDEIVLTMTPKLSGDEAAPSLADGPGGLGRPFLSLALLECRPAISGELFLRYQVLKDQ